VLELRPGGSWTAAYVTSLEALTGAVTARLDHSKAVKVDMAAVRELDTLGAWLLEKMSRRATSAGHRAEIVGVADNYAGLIEEIRQVNRRNPVPVPARNPVVAKVDEIGRAAVSSTEDKKSLRVVIHCLPRCRGKTSPRGRSIEAPACSSFLARVHCQAASERAVFVAGIAAGAMET